MQWLLNLSIKFKILSIAFVAMVGFVVILAFNYMATSSNTVRLHDVKEVYFPILERTDANIVRLDKIKETLNTAASAGEIEMIADADTILAAMNKTFAEMAEINPDIAASAEELKTLAGAYYKNAKPLTEGMIHGSLPPDRIKPAVDKMTASLKIFNNKLNAFRTANYEQFTGIIEEADEASNSALNIGLTIGLTILLLIGSIAVVVVGVITGNISGVVNAIRDMAQGQGDLRVRLESKSTDEIGQLVSYFNTFMDKLQPIIIAIVGSAEQVTVVADQLSSLSATSSAGLDRQNQEIGQVATATHEMAATVQEVARNAAQAAEAATEATESATRGSQVVTNTITSMDQAASGVNEVAKALLELKENSQKVGGVLDVIRGIAEQTNLLALNAAIEAARAGEQGRGFAVVADEVRTLASRTQESTQEIQSMIEQLQCSATQAVDVMEQGKTTTERGVQQAADAGDALKAITSSIEVINGMNTQIASAAEEQSAVAEEINKNVNNISLVAEQADQGAQQLNASSGELAGLARELAQQVGQFKV